MIVFITDSIFKSRQTLTVPGTCWISFWLTFSNGFFYNYRVGKKKKTYHSFFFLNVARFSVFAFETCVFTLHVCEEMLYMWHAGESDKLLLYFASKRILYLRSSQLKWTRHVRARVCFENSFQQLLCWRRKSRGVLICCCFKSLIICSLKVAKTLSNSLLFLLAGSVTLD